jgi:DNA-binding transcriptional LysR family regulator
MRYDLTSLELFVAVAEEANLTRAAGRQHLAVSAVSKRITELEELAEAPLLVRLPRGVSLTPAGQTLLHYARQVMRTVQQMRSELSEYAGGVKGHIRIHAAASVLTQFLPRELEAFLRLYPMIRLEIEERVGAAIVRAVSEGTTDLGILGSHTPAPGLATLPYHTDRLVLAVPPGHPLTKRKAVRFADALAYPFVSHHAASSLWTLMSQAAADSGKTIQQRIQVSSFDCMCKMVEANLGIAMLPVGVLGHHVSAGGIRTVDLKDAWAHRQLVIVVRDPQTLPFTTRTLIDHLLAAAGTTVPKVAVR